ncbi:MAG TPA: ATP-binding protein [Spirochaetota bacterium]|nr:ATP-binding protein [Spirochaetota bacterium]
MGNSPCLKNRSKVNHTLQQEKAANENTHNPTEASFYTFRLALDELLTNAIDHGNCGNPSAAVTVRIEYLAGKILISVRDEGPGFHAADLPDPRCEENRFCRHGRGLYILKALGDVRWDGERGCVRVEL